MLHSETLARVIQADREREIERTMRDRRLLERPDPAVAAKPIVARTGPATVPSSQAGRPVGA